MLSITVKTLDGQDRKFTVDDKLDVEAFKKQISDVVHISVASQRLIFHGKVLKDKDKLSDLGVDGKVVHLVERAPPSTSGGGNINPADQNLPPVDSELIERAVQRVLDRMQDMARFIRVRTNPLPDGSGVEMTVEIENNQEGPARGRLNHARHVLRHVQHVLHHVEQAQRRIDEAAAAAGASRSSELETTPKPPATTFDGSSQSGAATATVAQPITETDGCVDMDGDEDDSYSLELGDDDCGTESAGSGINSGPTSVDAFTETAGRRDQASGPDESPAAVGNSANRTGPNSGHQQQQDVSVTELADAFDDVLRVQDRLRPHIARYQALLREDPNFEGRVQEGRHAARFFNSIQLIMHNMAHIHHALSDMSVHFCEPAPRHLYPVYNNANAQTRSSMVLTFRNSVDHGTAPGASVNSPGRSASVPRRPPASQPASRQPAATPIRPALTALRLRPEGDDGATRMATMAGFQMAAPPAPPGFHGATGGGGMAIPGISQQVGAGGATIVVNPTTIQLTTGADGTIRGSVSTATTTTIPVGGSGAAGGVTGASVSSASGVADGTTPTGGSVSAASGSTTSHTSNNPAASNNAPMGENTDGGEAGMGANFFQQLMQGIAATTTAMTINNLGLGTLMNNGAVAAAQRASQGATSPNSTNPQTTAAPPAAGTATAQGGTAGGAAGPQMMPFQGTGNIQMTFGRTGPFAANSAGQPAMFMGMNPAGGMGQPGGGFTIGPGGPMGPGGMPIRPGGHIVAQFGPIPLSGGGPANNAASTTQGQQSNQQRTGQNEATRQHVHNHQQHHHHHHHHFDQGNTSDGGGGPHVHMGVGGPIRGMMQHQPHYHPASMFVGPYPPATSLPLITIDRYLPCGSRFFREVQNRRARGHGAGRTIYRARRRATGSTTSSSAANPIHSPEGTATHIAHHDHYGEPSGVASPPPPDSGESPSSPLTRLGHADGEPAASPAGVSVGGPAAGVTSRRRSASASGHQQSGGRPQHAAEELPTAAQAWEDAFVNQLEQTLRSALQTMTMNDGGMGGLAGMTVGNGGAPGMGVGRMGLMGMTQNGTPVGINVVEMQMPMGGAPVGNMGVGMANGVAMPQEITQLLSGVANQVATESDMTVGQFMRQAGLAEVGVDGPVSQLFLEILECLSFADVVNLMNRGDTSALDRNLPQMRQMISQRLFGGRANPTQTEIREQVHRIVFEDEDRMRQFVTADIRPREPDVDIAASVLSCEERMLSDLVLIIYGHRDVSGSVGQALYNRTLRGFRQIAQLGVHCCANGLPDFQRVVDNCLNGISMSNDDNVREEIPAHLRAYIAATGTRQLASLVGPPQIEGLTEFIIRRPATSAATLRQRAPSDQVSNEDEEFMDTVEQHSPTTLTATTQSSKSTTTPNTAVGNRPITPPLDGDDEEYTSDARSARFSSNAPVANGQMPSSGAKQESRPSGLIPAGAESQPAVATDGEAVDDTDDWKTAFPAEWVQIIDRDLSKQSLAPPQLPFSDAYLSGIPSRKRKRMMDDREDAMCARTDTANAIGHGLSQAVRSLGIQPITGASTEDVVNTITGEITAASVTVNGDTAVIVGGAAGTATTEPPLSALAAAFEDEQRERFRKRLRDDPDFRRDRFPNTDKYFMT